MNVLCLDCDDAFLAALRRSGFDVSAEWLGYKTGGRQIRTPPHEADAIVLNLETPACYDALDWGPGRNDNLHARIAKNPQDRFFIYQNEPRPQYQLIEERQIAAAVGSFGPQDILRAVTEGGRPFLVYLNSSFLIHLPPHRDLLNLGFSIERTIANKVSVSSLAKRLFPKLATDLGFKLPLVGRLREVQRRQGVGGRGITAVTNAVGDVFSILLPQGRGFVWLLPEFENPVQATISIVEQKDDIACQLVDLAKPAPIGRPPRQVAVTEGGGILDRLHAQPIPGTSVSSSIAGSGQPRRDLFISYASEDKEQFVRPLVDRLMEAGISVWFDEFELILGDRLRERIDNGLLAASHGLVILSHNFI